VQAGVRNEALLAREKLVDSTKEEDTAFKNFEATDKV
jgi:hypothetical protein